MSSFNEWLDGDIDLLKDLEDGQEGHDAPRQAIKAEKKRVGQLIDGRPETAEALLRHKKRFDLIYKAAAVAACLVIIGCLLFCVANLPRYGEENPRALAVTERYIEKGLEETGAVNIVAGMILDYRAFDTLGESHVLFTALVCVMILLRLDAKNMKRGFEDYYTVRSDRYFDISKDPILRVIGFILTPCILVYGIYILLNGHLSPGGGFSGGAVMGAGLIIFTSAFGFDRTDRFFTAKLFTVLSLFALGFYSFAKGYVFFMGANGLENGIPKGIPGAILSGGMILPLDIAVGLVVACTMFGFFSLFRRGSIGGAPLKAKSAGDSGGKGGGNAARQ